MWIKAQVILSDNKEIETKTESVNDFETPAVRI